MYCKDISIIVPFYNVGDTISDCLESILAQDYPHFEIICVDDRSQDHTRQIVEHFATIDRRISLLSHRKNLGLGPARNTGVSAARGTYVMFLDSDDRLSSPRALRHLLEAAIDTDSEMVIGRAQALRHDGTVSDWDKAFEHKYRKEGRLTHNLSGSAAYSALIRMPRANYLPLRSWGCLFQRAFYAELGLAHPDGTHEDIGHNALAASAAGNVHYASEIVVDYRLRAGSISRSCWNKQMIDRYLQSWTHFRDNHARFGIQSMCGNAALHVLQNWCWMLDRNGVETDDKIYSVNKMADLLSEVGPEADPEKLGLVTKSLFKTLAKLDLPAGTLAGMLDHMSSETLILGAQVTAGQRPLATLSPSRPSRRPPGAIMPVTLPTPETAPVRLQAAV